MITVVPNPPLMVDGQSLEIGQSAQLNVELDPRQDQEAVLTLPQQMVDKNVWETTTNSNPGPSVWETTTKAKNAIHRHVRLMVDGPTLEIGQSAQLNVELDPRQDQEAVLTLPQQMVDKNVWETTTNSNPGPSVWETTTKAKNAIHRHVRLMVDGPTLEIGQSAQLNVELDPRQDQEAVLTLPQQMVDKNVWETTTNSNPGPSVWETTTKAKNVIHRHVRLMVDGPASEIGRSAQLNVELDPRQDQEAVLTLPQQMVEQHVMETAVSAKDVTLLQAAAVETLALEDLTHSLL